MSDNLLAADLVFTAVTATASTCFNEISRLAWMKLPNRDGSLPSHCCTGRHVALFVSEVTGSTGSTLAKESEVTTAHCHRLRRLNDFMIRGKEPNDGISKDLAISLLLLKICGLFHVLKIFCLNVSYCYDV